MRTPSLARLCGGLLAAVLAKSVAAAPAANTTGRLVFAHLVVGITSDRTGPSDWDADFQRAKAMGIDAMALDIGTDPFTDTQLTYAYTSAANNNFKVFLSFDFNWWSPSNATAVALETVKWMNQTAQLMYDGKAFWSSFAGDGLNVTQLRELVPTPLYVVPNFHPGQSNFTDVDGALNWLGWPSNGNNKAPTPGANVTVEDGDNAYIAALNGKAYMAPASPWFFTHYGPEVSYSKNWVFPSDLLWYNRWNELLTTVNSQFVEIVTWNDYGESHYVGPLSSPHYDDGASKWANDMPHDGWLNMAAPYIAAYKNGDSTPDAYITADLLTYWYRPQPSYVNCDSTDTTANISANNASGNYFEGRPNGWQDLQDAVFLVALLTEPGIIHMNSGNYSQSFNAPKGASAFQVPMGIGQQSFALERNCSIVMGQTSLKDIIDGCVCGLYNYNAYVGTVPQEPPFPDQLQPAGIGSLTIGLHVSTCAATPSLGTSTIPYPSASSAVCATTTRSSSAMITYGSSSSASAGSGSGSSSASASRTGSSSTRASGSSSSASASSRSGSSSASASSRSSSSLASASSSASASSRNGSSSASASSSSSSASASSRSGSSSASASSRSGSSSASASSRSGSSAASSSRAASSSASASRTTTASATTSTPPGYPCNRDNCLRAFINEGHYPNHSFCSGYTNAPRHVEDWKTSCAYNEPLPTYATACGTGETQAPRMLSACSCLYPQPTGNHCSGN